MARNAVVCLLLSAAVAVFLIARLRSKSFESGVDFSSLKGGEIIAIKSLFTGKYLELQPLTGKVAASAAEATDATSHWRVLVLDTDTVATLLRSARTIDEKSSKFTGRRMVTASGCACSGYSNSHGLGRFCYPWENMYQDAWCYVSDNCSSATSRGSFGRRYESCDLPPPDMSSPSSDGMDEYARMQSQQSEESGAWGGSSSSSGVPRLVPASGCNCSGFSSALGYGSSCKGWEYEGQAPWCYVARDCHLLGGGAAGSRWARNDNGSFGQPYEQCVWRTPEDPLPSGRRLQQQRRRWRRRRLASSSSPSPGRRLQTRSKELKELLASAPELERYVVLISVFSHSFMSVEPPPHKESLELVAKSDELSMRSIFSSFESTKLILSLATNSLLNLCDAATEQVCTGSRRRPGEPLRLLRMPRRTARWLVELIR